MMASANNGNLVSHSFLLGLKRILDYSVNIQIFGYLITILNIRIIVSKEIYDMNM